MSEKAKLDWLEVAELAMHVCDLPDDSEPHQIDQALCDKFEMGFDQFHKLAELLVPMCAVGSSPLTGRKYRGFAHGDIWLAKQELAPPSVAPVTPRDTMSGFAIEDCCDADD